MMSSTQVHVCDYLFSLSLCLSLPLTFSHRLRLSLSSSSHPLFSPFTFLHHFRDLFLWYIRLISHSHCKLESSLLQFYHLIHSLNTSLLCLRGIYCVRESALSIGGSQRWKYLGTDIHLHSAKPLP
ncbi:hypothetical protein F5Y07DRAFT_372050 [Xylaria sp. FL0933]|nr:hypothetical protein F5Y07DRAFT_372050 [Xylaria sp. FL0933]